MAQDSVPLVFVGNINGHLDKALRKLEKVKKTLTSSSQREPRIFVCGDVFGTTPATLCGDYLSGSKKFPLPLYILGATCEEQTAAYNNPQEQGMLDILENVTFIGKFGVLLLPEQMTIAYISGYESTTRSVYTFTEEDVKELMRRCAKFPRIDVLLSYQWPQGVETVHTPATVRVKQPSKLLAMLVANIKPRLHVAAMEAETFLTPYMVHGNDPNLTTMFHGLTSLANYKTGKWVYAVNLPLVSQRVDPCETVPSPFGENVTSVNRGYFYDMSEESKQRRGPSYDPNHRKWKMEVVVSQKSCWFCLANDKVDRSLIVAVANDVYLALAKGPVVEDQVMILPIRHISRMSEAPDGVVFESKMFLESLRKFYNSQGKALVWFERCFKSPHCQIDALPVDPSLISRGIIHEEICVLAKKKGLEVEILNLARDTNLRAKMNTQFFWYLQLGGDRGYFIDIKEESHFPINFGRIALSRALGVPEREFWKNCIEDEDTVSRALIKFREGFRPFNFTVTKNEPV